MMFRHSTLRGLSRKSNFASKKCFSDLAKSEKSAVYNRIIIASEVVVGTIFALQILSVFSAYSLVKYPVQFERGLDDDLRYAVGAVDSILGLVGISKTSDATIKQCKDYILDYYQPMVEAYKYFGFVETSKEVSILDRFRKPKAIELSNSKDPNETKDKVSDVEQD